VPTLEDELLEQVQFLNLTPAERILAEQIIGSLEHDGYLDEGYATVFILKNFELFITLYKFILIQEIGI
jgi:DNA-directed RNA polymerase specialized sigma54-like protein